MSSEVPEQPFGLSQIVKGAKTRAENSYKLGNCTYGIGIESGIYEIYDTWFDTCVGAIFYGGPRSVGSSMSMDSREFNLIGFSSAFPIPNKVGKLIQEKKLNLGQALYELGLTSNPQLGLAEGAIGLLTKGRMTRKEQIKIGLRMALVSLENPEMFYPK